MYKLLSDKLQMFYKKGLFHIFGTSIINNAIQFLTNIFIINMISKNSYGVYTYANNIVSFFLLVRGLGLCSGLIQFASEQEEKTEKQKIYNYVLMIGNIFNILLSLIMVVTVFVMDIKIEGARAFLLFMSLLPIFQWMFDYITTVFRTQQDNISYAKITNINTISFFVFSLIGAYFFDAYGVIIGRYLAFLVSILLGIYWLKDDFKNMMKYNAKEYCEKKEIIKYSFTACASNSLSELLYLLDVFLIGVYVADASYIASYKVATQIPAALAFIPMGIITFIYPYFAAHNQDIKWIKKQFALLLESLAIINGIICTVLFVFAPYIIRILWGMEYMDSIIPFRILAFNYFFLGTFRIPCGNILAMLRKVNVNFYISIISSVANIVLDIVLIKKYGAIGAALATLLVVLISSGIAFPYLLHYIYLKSKKGRRVYE